MTISFNADDLLRGIVNPDYESLIGKSIIFMGNKVGVIKEYSDGKYIAEIDIRKKYKYYYEKDNNFERGN